MKKKIIKLFFIILSVCAFTSCFSNPNYEEHTEHTFGEWIVVQEATCINEGMEMRYCTCGYAEQRFTGFTEHRYSINMVHEGNCNEMGFILYVCDFCGNKYEEQTTKTDHNYTIVERVEPVCEQDGYIRYFCNSCGDSYSETLPSEECSFTITKTHEGNCLEQGYITYVCNKNPDHSYIEYTGEYGEHQYNISSYGDCHVYEACIYCHENHPQQGILFPHNFGQWQILKNATCLQSGYKVRECKDCGYYEEETINPQHTFSNSICVLCQDHMPSECLIYEQISDTECAVIGITEAAVEQLVIPNIHQGLYVTEIKTNAFKNKTINSIVIPKSMKRFRNDAFLGINGLANVYYKATLNDWFNLDFAYTYSNNICSTPANKGVTIHFLDQNNQYYAPTNLVIPNEITRIERFKFANFEQLTSVTFHDNIDYIGIGAFFNCDNLENIDIKAKQVEEMAFGDCNKLTTAAVSGDIKSLPPGMFIYDEALVNVTLPESLEVIGESVFLGCTSLANIEIPNNVKDMRAGIFYGCTSLQNVVLPNQLQSIDGYMFYGCSNLNYNELDGALYLGSQNNPKLMLISYSNETITHYTVNSEVRFIEQEAISNCPSLVELIIPQTVLDYVPYFIRSCAALTRLTMPYYDIGSIDEVFNYNRFNLEYLCINGGEISHRNAIANYPQLKEIVITDNVKRFESVNFNNLPKLEKLTIPHFNGNDFNTTFDSIIDETIKLKYLNIYDMEKISISFLQNHQEIEELYLPDNLKVVTGYVSDISEDLKLNSYENGLYLGSENNPYLLLVGMDDQNVEEFVIHPNTQAVMSYRDFVYTEINDVWYLGTNQNPYKYVYFNNTSGNEDVEIIEGAEIILASENSSFANFQSLTLPSTIKEIKDAFSTSSQGQALYYNGSIVDWSNIKFYSPDNNPMCHFKELYYKPEKDGEYVKLEDLILPEEITSINDYQFAGFKVSKIKLHNNLSYVGRYSFAYSKFDSFDFGNTVDTISDFMFYYATTNNITIPNTITAIGRYSFGYAHINSVELPDSINRIGENGFIECNLSTLHMSSIEHISDYAFFRTNIYELYFNGTVYDWLENGFMYESSTPVNTATNVYFKSLEDGQWYQLYDLFLSNDNIRSIGSYQFLNFAGLNYIQLPTVLEEIGKGAFKNTGIYNIEIPNNVERINDYAFANTNINQLVLGENLSFIGFGIIQDTYIYSLVLPYLGETPDSESRYKNIPYLFGCLYYDEFTENYTLGSVKILSGSIGTGAFYNCSALYELIMPDIESVPAYAFYNCRGLSELDLGNELEGISNNAFENSSLYKLTLPKTISYFGTDAFINANVIELYYEDKLSNWSRIRTYNMNSTPVFEETTIYSLVDNEFVIENVIVVPNDVTTLYPYIFRNFDNLDELYILENVTYINEGIINACDMIQKLVIPFVGSENSEYASYSSFEYLVKDGWINNIAEIELLEGMRILQSRAFSEIYSLKKFTLPKSVTTIYSEVFNNSPIEEFVYKGTIDDWNRVVLDSNTSNPAYYGADVYMFNSNNELELLQTIHTIEEGLYVEKHQYAGFNSVKNVYVSSNITIMCEGAFYNCEGIENVYYNSTLDNWLLIYHAQISANPNCYTDNFYVMENSEYVIPTEAIVPENDNYNLFYSLVGIKSLKKITIPSNKINIVREAYYGLDALEEIYYEGTQEEYLSIVNYGYVDHPYTLYVYDEDDNYTTITSVTYGEYDPVHSYQLTGIRTLETVIVNHESFEIPQHFVAHCEGLKNVIIPTNTKTQNINPFKGCVGLVGNRYEGCIYIGNEENPYVILAGTYDKEMTDLIIHNDVKGIAHEALLGCEGIKNITTPISVVWDHYSSEPGQLDIDTITYTGNENLMNSGMSPNKVVFVNGILSANTYHHPLNDYSIKEVIFENAYYVNDMYKNSWISEEYMNVYENGYYLGNEQNPYLVLCYVKSDATNVTIHEDTEVIASCAFEYCSLLSEITIPDKVKYISNNAFRNCNALVTVNMGSGVEYIGEYAFYNCLSLTSINLPEGIKEIGVAAFSSTNLSYIVIPKETELIQFTAFDFTVAIYCMSSELPSNLEESSNSIYLKNEWAYDSYGNPYPLN